MRRLPPRRGALRPLLPTGLIAGLLAAGLGLLQSSVVLAGGDSGKRSAGRAAGSGNEPSESQHGESPPPGVEQIIPRGALPPILDPEFVSAEDAALPDSQWILGVVWDGDARAYDLNLLNEHEVVNDHVGGRPIAAVW